MVWRSCWRRCSIHEPIRKVSINSPGRSISSYTAQLTARAAAHPAQLVHRLQKRFRVVRVDDVLVRDQHRAALVRQVDLHAVQRWPLRSRFKSGSFSSFQRNTVALASTIPSVATTSEVGVPNCDAICPQRALPAVIEPKNTVR